MTIEESRGLNYFWSQLFVEECVRNGADYFCVSPGSRSTSLVLAVAENKKAKSIVHIDERASGFHALGYSSALGKPSVVITTSGSAVGNLLPAIIEASKKKVPLLIVTADRPPELRFTGANQTVDQVKIFGEYVRWFFDIPCPTEDIDPEYVLTTTDQALYKSHSEIKGPVHLNMMFREPLEPTKTCKSFNMSVCSIDSWLQSNDPYTKYKKSVQILCNEDIADLTKAVDSFKTGIIVVGKLSDSEEMKGVCALSEKLNWPIFPDITSGLRLGYKHPNIISYFDQMLSLRRIQCLPLECVIHLGGRMTSKAYYEYIDSKDLKKYIMVLNHSLRNDPLHNVTDRIQSSMKVFCQDFNSKISKKKDTDFLDIFITANEDVQNLVCSHWEIGDDLVEAKVVRSVSQLTAANHNIFLGNSLTIRMMDSFSDYKGNVVRITANRGASGIDGTIASACGFTEGTHQRTTLILGDLSALYDLNSFSMLNEGEYPITMIILNNNGGRIFSYLPVSGIEKKVFKKFFTTPSSVDFRYGARMFDVEYNCPTTMAEFSSVYNKSIKLNSSSIIEVKINPDLSLKLGRKWEQRLISLSV